MSATPGDATPELTPEILAWMKTQVRQWEDQGLDVAALHELLFRTDMAMRIGWPDEAGIDQAEREFREEAVRQVVGPRWWFVRKQVEVAADYGWRTAFADEPDGSVRGHLVDEERGEVLKTYRGDDFHDAWLGLGMDTYPPSAEGRRK
jgi:hypothetical protein